MPSSPVELFADLLNDESRALARRNFCNVVMEEPENVAAWITMDTFLGGSDTRDTGASHRRPTRRDHFSAVSIVAETATSLARATLKHLDEDDSYPAAVLVRQLIECEYLLTLFHSDFNQASVWFNSADMWDFRPKRLRKLGGFDDEEYRMHCDMGGHPNPQGRFLLKMHQQISSIRLPGTAPAPFDPINVQRLDFAYHLDRIWSSLTSVLAETHPRFSQVRTQSLRRVTTAREEWRGADPLSNVQLAKALKAAMSSQLAEGDQSIASTRHE